MRRVVMTALLILATAQPRIGQTSGQKGLEIATQASVRAAGFGDLSASLRMVVRNGRGAERVRELTIQTLEVDGAGERSVVRFHAPRDLRGTALLTVNNTDVSADQWLYLPSLHRVKRIAGGTRSGSFMGSEFAYEDVSPTTVDQYTYRLLHTDSMHRAWVVERRPIDESSQYSRQLVWYDQQEYRILQIDYYDRTDTLLKTLFLRDFALYEQRFWRPAEMEMVNRQTGASTLLQWTDMEFDRGLPPSDFDPNRLAREH
jgi:outer membrane lipoprotein-sorting protein